MTATRTDDRLRAIGKTVEACRPVYRSGQSAVLLPDGSSEALATNLLTALLAAGDEVGRLTGGIDGPGWCVAREEAYVAAHGDTVGEGT